MKYVSNIVTWHLQQLWEISHVNINDKFLWTFYQFFKIFLVFSDFSFSTVDITDGLDYNTDKICLFSDDYKC